MWLMVTRHFDAVREGNMRVLKENRMVSAQRMTNITRLVYFFHKCHRPPAIKVKGGYVDVE